MFDPLEHARHLDRSNRWWAVALRWSGLALVAVAIHVTFFLDCPPTLRDLACQQAAHMQRLVTEHRDRTGGCPRDVADLVANRAAFVDAVDPWGMPYAIACTDAQVTIASSGPDREPGTVDDVSGGSCGGWWSTCAAD
jgi:hypothetical protein